MTVIKTPLIRKLAHVGIRAGAITILWWCICDPDEPDDSPALELHEPRHGVQQLVTAVICIPLFAAAGWYWSIGWMLWLSPLLGTVVWFWLYLVGFPLGLPKWFNLWREWMERDAYRAQGYLDFQITGILKRTPYFLKWQLFG